MLTLLWPALAAAATPILGVQYTPFSRADLVWVQDGRTSGVAVGEFDGTVNPALEAFGGVWFNKRLGLVGSLGVARLTSTTWTGSDYTNRSWGVVRPEADLRIAFGPRKLFRPAPWAYIGLYGDIPSARDTSNTYSASEQQSADQNAYIERARLGGIGGQVGAGVDFRVHQGIALGALWGLQLHRGVIKSDQIDTVTSWLGTHASLLLTFEWPKPSKPPAQPKAPAKPAPASAKPAPAPAKPAPAPAKPAPAPAAPAPAKPAPAPAAPAPAKPAPAPAAPAPAKPAPAPAAPAPAKPAPAPAQPAPAPAQPAPAPAQPAPAPAPAPASAPPAGN